MEADFNLILLVILHAFANTFFTYTFSYFIF